MENREILLAGFGAAPREERARTFAILGFVLLAVAAILLSACESISSEECLAADWYSLGVEDGAKGYSLSRLGAYRKDCAEVGVAPDAEMYSQGRMVGLESFCTYERGYAEGKRGAGNRAVCPPGPLEAEFMQGYNDGRYVYETNRKIRDLERRLADLREEMGQIRTDMQNGYRVDSAGVQHELGQYERGAMVERLLTLSKEEGRLEGEISTLYNNIAGS